MARLKAVLLSRSTKEVLTLSPSANSAATPNRLLFDICPCEYQTEGIVDYTTFLVLVFMRIENEPMQ